MDQKKRAINTEANKKGFGGNRPYDMVGEQHQSSKGS